MEWVRVKQACEYLDITKQMMYHLIKTGRIMWFKHGSRIYVSRPGLDEYTESKYSRKKYFKRGEGSIKEMAKYVDCHFQRLYYLLRKGLLPHRKVGALFILKYKDMDEIKMKNPEFFIGWGPRLPKK